MQLIRVCLQIVELGDIVDILDQFIPVGAQTAEVAQGGDAVLAVGVRLTAQQRRQAAGVDLRLRRQAGHLA